MGLLYNILDKLYREGEQENIPKPKRHDQECIYDEYLKCIFCGKQKELTEK
jgi:hypothetical protein